MEHWKFTFKGCVNSLNSMNDPWMAIVSKNISRYAANSATRQQDLCFSPVFRPMRSMVPW